MRAPAFPPDPLLTALVTRTRTVIEAINNYREPQPTMEAMYIIMPTSQNVERVIRDFSNGLQQYAAAHLFFVDGTSPSARRAVEFARC